MAGLDYKVFLSLNDLNSVLIWFQWTLDLTEYEKTFLDQAAEVNAWDRLLMENGEKVGVPGG